jgi:transglycosylase-like protein with SLT domain
MASGRTTASAWARDPRRVLAASTAVLAVAVLVAVASGGGGGTPGPPLPGIGRPARAGDPFAYSPAREAAFAARVVSGSAHVLFTKSPGGALATAARVAAYRPLIDAAVAGRGVDPRLVEGIVFVESAGRPDVIAGGDPTGAAGLTQILAQTGQSLLGMHVDLARTRKAIAAIQQNGLTPRLEAQLAKADDRFDPRKALAATVRYLTTAQQRFGRADLAVVSYHMGIGNLQQVLDDYDSGHAVPYAQLYFDTAPDHNSSAYNLLSGFGDQSSLYYWRVLGAVQIMALYRSDRSALARLAALESAGDSAAAVLHPPDHTQSFSDPGALASAYGSREILPLPSNSAKLGLAYYPTMGSLGRQVGAPAALYRGLRPVALDLLVELAARVRALSGGASPLTVTSSVTDARYQSQLGITDPQAVTGFSFEIARTYTSRRQAAAFQAMLDRLQALNLIAWVRGPDRIEITVASDASRVIVDGP